MLELPICKSRSSLSGQLISHFFNLQEMIREINENQTVVSHLIFSGGVIKIAKEHSLWDKCCVYVAFAPTTESINYVGKTSVTKKRFGKATGTLLSNHKTLVKAFAECPELIIYAFEMDKQRLPSIELKLISNFRPKYNIIDNPNATADRQRARKAEIYARILRCPGITRTNAKSGFSDPHATIALDQLIEEGKIRMEKIYWSGTEQITYTYYAI